MPPPPPPHRDGNAENDSTLPNPTLKGVVHIKYICVGSYNTMVVACTSMRETNIIRKPASSFIPLVCGGLSSTLWGWWGSEKDNNNNNSNNIVGSRYYLRSTEINLPVHRKYTCIHTHSNVCDSGGKSSSLRGGGLVMFQTSYCKSSVTLFHGSVVLALVDY